MSNDVIELYFIDGPLRGAVNVESKSVLKNKVYKHLNQSAYVFIPLPVDRHTGAERYAMVLEGVDKQ